MASITETQTLPHAPELRRLAPWAKRNRRIIVAWYCAGVCLLALVALIWSYRIAEQLIFREEQEAAQVAASTQAADGLQMQAVDWLGPDFTVTAETATLLVAAAAAAAGSAFHLSHTLSRHASGKTVEREFAWYVVQPVSAVVLGVFAVLAVNTSLVSIGDQATSSAGLAVLTFAAALAGLFTDKVLQRMRGLLGVTDQNEQASNKQPSQEKV